MLPLTISATTDAVNSVSAVTMYMKGLEILNPVSSTMYQEPGDSKFGLMSSGILKSPDSKTASEVMNARAQIAILLLTPSFESSIPSLSR